ncbi:hypothetical protein ACFSTH_12685 [Paenibacillus yanchengensis]|uniref:Aldose 1-epimerase n=1 Tax=Paenibacillus yanchengensis TaxID=2035833 RepID=A0ABW4YIP9_9BACL
MSHSLFRITETSFHEVRAFTMESNKVKLVMLPDQGASIVSLQYKPTAKEWLVQSPHQAVVRQTNYGDDFSEAVMHGYDECFPTINVCNYPVEGKYEGALLPDHGEVWSIPWAASVVNNKLVTTVAGQALPYSLEREIAFVTDSCLRFNYTVTSKAEEELALFWCAHPLFTATDYTRIHIPKDAADMLCVVGGKRYNANQTYTFTNDNLDKRGIAINQVAPVTTEDSRKFYIDQPYEDGQAALVEENTGEYLQMNWDSKQLPYFGLWINEGHYNKQRMVALEPCNGYYDNLALAYEREQTLLLPAGRAATWSYTIEFGEQK